MRQTGSFLKFSLVTQGSSQVIGPDAHIRMGDHCPRGLGCHAVVVPNQRGRSAVPLFRRMLASHERELQGARQRQEPAGQIAGWELEVDRIQGALRRAEERPHDVAVAMEGALSVQERIEPQGEMNL